MPFQEDNLINRLVYRGEGNDTIVLSDYQNAVIYRFRKKLVNEANHSDCTTANRKANKKPKCLDVSCLFREHIMRNYLGASFISPMETCYLSVLFLAEIKNKIHAFRPQHRLSKDIDLSNPQVTTSPDAAFLPAKYHSYVEGAPICVELKPKCGFIPLTNNITASVKHSVCRFCMMQYNVTKTSLWKQQSQYCPCDLFSGEPRRMRHALKCLIEVPQINFRLFKNGVLEYTQDSTNIEGALHDLLSENGNFYDCLLSDFLDLLVQALTRELPVDAAVSNSNPKSAEETCNPLPNMATYHQRCRHRELLLLHSQKPDSSESETLFQYFPEASATELSWNSPLGRVLAVQLLDTLDVEGIYPHYQLVKDWLHQQGYEWDSGLANYWKNNSDLPQEVAAACTLLEQYLIAAVAKDCSLMIVIQRCRPGISEDTAETLPLLSDRQGRSYLYHTTLVDLDPKIFDRIVQHYRLDFEITRDYLRQFPLAANFPASI